jgi:4-amino-4-deoxy-L-arabinose transferase-like glycosyltransferase
MSRAPRRKTPSNDSGPPLSPLPPTVPPLTGAWRWSLPLLMLLYLGLAVLHAQFVPIGQTGYQNAPDEAAHVSYVHTIAAGRLPVRPGGAEGPSSGVQAASALPSYEWHQPPLYYGLAALFVKLGDRGLRTSSILCGLVGLLFIYRASRLLVPGDPLIAVVATGIAALTPSHIAITSTVNNDALLEVCFSGALLVMIGALLGGLTLRRAGWIGAAIGAAILTKATGLLLIPVALFSLGLLWRLGEPPRRLWQGAAWMFSLCLAICGWWFLRNHQIYHEWLPLEAFRASFASTTQAADVASGRVPGLPVESRSGYYILVANWTFRSFWAVYGTPRSAVIGAPRFLEDQIYLLLAVLSLAVMGGLLRLHLRRKIDFTEVQSFAIWLFVATIGMVGLAFVGFIMQYFQTQGRYLYPAMLPICLLFALGWRALFPTRYAALAGGMLLVLLAVVDLAFLRQVAP